MRYFAARQRQTDSRYDYTCQDGRGVYPVGYCAGWRELDPDTVTLVYGPGGQDRYRAWRTSHEPLIPNYHDDGHATEAEACDCYRRYLLDTQLWFGSDPDAQRRCAECGVWTSGIATVDHRTFTLCEAHQTRECVERQMPAIGQITSS